MRVPLRSAILVALTLATSACSGGAGSLPQSSSTATAAGKSQPRPIGDVAAPSGEWTTSTDRLRETSLSGFPAALSAFPITLSAFPVCVWQQTTTSAQCHASQNIWYWPNPNPSPNRNSLPGVQPADLWQRYLRAPYSVKSSLPNGGWSKWGAGTTVAVVVAYAAPNVEKDLNVYRSEFLLGSCTIASGCLKIVAEPGVQQDPQGLWPVEAALDVEMVAAMCQRCTIMVVEAANADIANLSAADDLAVANGATAVSNSWSLPESPGALKYASHFNHPGVPITAGAGDGGYGVSFPSDLATVTSVGGTSLTTGSTQSESIWSLTGGGCSSLVSKPSWQTDSGCKGRTVNDIAVVGDPGTGVATYVSSAGGWIVLGGTSVGSPIVASMYSISGQAGSVNDASGLYSRAQGTNFNHVTSGSDGSCWPYYLCSGNASGASVPSGYDAPAGLGSPNGLNPFGN